ncbi:hypothetical protein LINPERPRIM_LOCUS3166 [Linum perenne]
MAPFDFKSDLHFVASSDKLTLRIFELNKNTTANPSSTRKTHWSQVAIIIPGDDDDEEEYDGLAFFDGQGQIQGREALTKLAQELTRLRLMVSPEGYCYQDVTELGEHKDFGIHYLRLNDTFDWSRYHVDLFTTTVWSRSKLRYVVPKSSKQPKVELQQRTAGAVISKEKYEEMKKVIKEKDKELEKLREEKDEAERLKEDAEEDLQKLKDEKENEIKEKDSELRKLRRLKDSMVQKKDEELRKLKKEKEALQKRENELLQKLSKENDGDGDIDD